MRKLLLALAQPATHTQQSKSFPNLAESAKLRTRMSVRGMLERVNTGILAGGRHGRGLIDHDFRVEDDPQKTFKTHCDSQKGKRGTKKSSGQNHKGRASAVASDKKSRGNRRNKGKREGQTKWGQKRERGRRWGGARKEGNPGDFQLRRVCVICGLWHAGEVTQILICSKEVFTETGHCA